MTRAVGLGLWPYITKEIDTCIAENTTSGVRAGAYQGHPGVEVDAKIDIPVEHSIRRVPKGHHAELQNLQQRTATQSNIIIGQPKWRKS